jgi:hypothetical protein
MGLLKEAEAFLYLWLINPRISHGIVGETGLLGEWLHAAKEEYPDRDPS